MSEIWRCPKCGKETEMLVPAKAMWCYHEKSLGRSQAVKMKEDDDVRS